MVNKSPVISNCNILIWLVCHKISFVKEKTIYFSFRFLDKFLYLSTCIVLRIKEINLKIDSTCIKMHMTILHVITCRFSYILNDIIYKYQNWFMEGVGYTDIYFLSESVVARMGFTQYMYKTFLNRTKDILKCVKDKTNSMHFS